MRDVAIIGAGAAGLATAIFARRADPTSRVVVFDGARRPGPNTVVSDSDFWGGKRTIVRRILRAFRPADAVELFHALGVPLHEEADGKLFPDSNRARDVLEALLKGVSESGAVLRAGTRVHAVSCADDRFTLATSEGLVAASRVVLASGGQSLPQT